MSAPVAVIGSGIGGLVTALALAPQPVLLITGAELGAGTSSAWAQGGIAAALGEDDSPELHLEDTLGAGDGLSDRNAARAIVSAAPEVIAFLERHGVIFDREENGAFQRGLEAAHSRHRILHAGGDASGAAIVAALAKAVAATPSVTVMSGTEVRRLLVENNTVRGLLCVRNDRAIPIETGRVVLATGGIGGLYHASTNPAGNFGQGVMLAARAGAALSDMEFVQFHPTALATATRPLPLISEAVRGEGAILVDDRGERFLAGIPGAELAPRDVVARAIAAEMALGRKVFLDAPPALRARFATRFPAITGICARAGIDPATDRIPVRPAEHYHMGGVATDIDARTTVSGLWAVGECAATGLHGANRLASNSLLEAAAAGLAAARDIAARPGIATSHSIATAVPPAAQTDRVRSIVSRHLGVIRNGPALATAVTALLPLAQSTGPDADPAVVALSIAVFATLRTESRGAHARSDFPEKTAHPRRQTMTLDDIFTAAGTISGAHPIRHSLARSA
ncbi:UNVERIFIED_ORG: L-aspartate oxidase [Martelella mediterranea]